MSNERYGVLRNGRIELEDAVDWPDGTRVQVRADRVPEPHADFGVGRVIIAGFGLAGRCVADFVAAGDIDYVIVERNPVTVETQRALGRTVIAGDVSDEATLEAAGVRSAAVLALTVPEEDAVLRATELARRLNPKLYIIARTTYASCGMKAIQLGADDVIKSEQAVALQFHEKLKDKIVHGGLSTRA